ncbi:MAG: glycoside hydrolase family 97 N-terminal domain-containing protein [Luteolibacter sp.]
MFRIVYLFLLGGALTVARAETLASPDGSLGVEVSVVGTRLSYALRHDSKVVVQTSPLGFTLNGVDCGDNVAITSSVADDVDETFPSRHGVHTNVRNRYHGKRITVNHQPSGITYVLNLRAFDSGIAFRYELTHRGLKEVTAETSSFILPERTWIWSQRGTGVYENIYSGADLNSIAAGAVMGPPVVSRLPDNAGYVAITQSTPGDGFPNPFLTKTAGRALQVTYPKNADGSHGASVKDNAYTPWNVVMVGSTLNELVNSDIVESLAPAPDPAVFPEGLATSWARPGRSVWDWMSRFPGGITAENAKLNSYWANQLGWEYNTIDEGWGNWNNGDPWQKVREITAHADPLGVRILLWVRSSNLTTREMRTGFFKKLKSAGVSGFKADFFDFDSVSPAAKERVELVEAILKEAATYHLVADLHGTGKPIGQFRTYPNLLNLESVFGKEQFPNAAASVYPPFSRLLAGPADYTPLGLEGNLKGNRTAAFEIATVVNMAGPLVTLAERSDTIAKSAFAPVLRAIPFMWDDTTVLQGSEVGESCAMARRKGDDWYVAIMNADKARTWSLPLAFLKPGVIYQAEIIRDGSKVIEYRTVTNGTGIEISCTAGGGFVARLRIPSTAGLTSLPFITNFGTGRGALYADRGKVLLKEAWANALLSDRLPDTMWAITGSGKALHAELDYADPYQGGASLKVSGTLNGKNDLMLYRAKLPVTASTRFSLVFKRGKAGADSDMQVGLTFTNGPRTPVFFNAGPASSAGWNPLELDLASHAGRFIESISLRFETAAATSGYEMRIGGLAIYDAMQTAVCAPGNLRVERSSVSGVDCLDAALAWNAPGGAARYHRIYQKNPMTGERVWLGATAVESFEVSGAHRIGNEPEAVFEVESVGGNGAASSPVRVAVPLPERPVLTNRLTGVVVGSTGTFAGSKNTREMVYDNDVKTYFDASSGNGIWAGVDLGATSASSVTAVRFFPREQWSDRMVGGVFQGANHSDFSDAEMLAKVDINPRSEDYTILAVKCERTFRYLRYLSPDGGWGNVAEVQFYGPQKGINRSF